MDVRHKRDEMIDQARLLYARGMNLKEVSEVLGLFKDTVRKWRKQDEASGISWDKERELQHKLRPDHIMKLLQRRFAMLVLEGEGAPGDESDKDKQDCEGRLLKILKVISGLRKTADDITHILMAMEEFEDYCVGHLTRDKIKPVRKAVTGFINKIRSENR